MKPKETINLYRVISLLVIALVTFGVMGGLCAKSHLYPDEWLSMFFLTLIFLLVCIFELEYERKQKGISANTQTTFIRLSVTYTVSGGLIYAISYLPEFYRPVMIPVILLTAVSNSMVAVSFGLFFDLVLALTVGGSFYALAAYMMLTMLAAVLAQALKEKKYRMGVSLLTFFFSLMIPELFSYLSTKEMQKYSLLYAFGTASAGYRVRGLFGSKSPQGFFHGGIPPRSESFRHCLPLCKRSGIPGELMSCRRFLLPYGALDRGAIYQKCGQ